MDFSPELPREASGKLYNANFATLMRRPGARHLTYFLSQPEERLQWIGIHSLTRERPLTSANMALPRRP